jgi:hypothetical protein
MKTSELTGAALDWAVAKCEGATDFESDGITLGFKLDGILKVLATGWAPSMSYHPSTNWAQAGPIIEREGIAIGRTAGGVAWDAVSPLEPDFMHRATTPLIAAMRCYVASKLGNEVEIPKELT